MGQEEFDVLLGFFKALGNESRLKIVGLLAVGPHTVGELAEKLDLTEPTVSHHLSRLKASELVRVRVDGNNRIYSLRTGRLESMNRDLFTTNKMASLVEEQFAGDKWERKVLATFVKDGKIISIPAQLKKRLVIMRWLAEKFAPDRRYSEAEVNEIIGLDNDYASWRRYLISQRFMAREQGVYWRLPREAPKHTQRSM